MVRHLGMAAENQEKRKAAFAEDIYERGADKGSSLRLNHKAQEHN